jgi:SNF family Na+-dependent transporter
MFTYINKKFQGIGWATVVVSFFVSIYYAIILCWSVFFFFQSFLSPLPWSKEATLNSLAQNMTSNLTKDNNEDYVNIDYFPKEVLAISEGLGHMGGLNGHLAICLIITYVLIYFCIEEGIKSSSKVAYFTAPAPIVLLFVLFFK